MARVKDQPLATTDEVTIIRQSPAARTEVSFRWTDWDHICTGVHRMPQSRRWLQPLGFLLLGVAATAAFEWHRAVPGSDDRGDYLLAALLFALGGIICVVCDHILFEELNVKAVDHLEWLERLEDTFQVPREGEKPWRATTRPRYRAWFRSPKEPT